MPPTPRLSTSRWLPRSVGPSPTVKLSPVSGSLRPGTSRRCWGSTTTPCRARCESYVTRRSSSSVAAGGPSGRRCPAAQRGHCHVPRAGSVRPAAGLPTKRTAPNYRGPVLGFCRRRSGMGVRTEEENSVHHPGCVAVTSGRSPKRNVVCVHLVFNLKGSSVQKNLPQIRDRGTEIP